MTQTQLARETGVSQVAIANYEKGNRFPSEEHLRNISQTLKTSLDNLLSIHFNEFQVDKRSAGNVKEFMDIVLNKSTLRSREYLSQWVISDRYSLSDIYNKIFIPLLVETGELWRKGIITAAQEHIVSEVVRELIYVSSLNYSSHSHRPDSPVWLGLCAPGEDHDLALLMNACLLREAGWRVLNLGINVPMPDLKMTISNNSVDVVNFSITRGVHSNGLRMVLDVLEKEFSGKIKVIVSGSGAESSLQDFYPIVHSVSHSLEESVKMAESGLDIIRGIR